MTEEKTVCTDCDNGYYHNYNGVWLCQSCGEPRDKPEDPQPAPKPRKRRSTDG